MRIALAQINPTLGDFSYNRKKMESFIERATERHCDLVVFPELSLFGYSPNDLLEHSEVVEEQLAELKKMSSKDYKATQALVGCVTLAKGKGGKPFHNSVAFLSKKKPHFFHKTLLPAYDVFDEPRYFRSEEMSTKLFKHNGKNILLLICEDIWTWDESRYKNHLKSLKSKKVDLVISMNASPFALGKTMRRQEMVRKTARFFKCPVAYVNMVGAQDEVIYDGQSFVLDAKGRLLAQSAAFEEDLNIIDLSSNKGGVREVPTQEAEILRQALVTGIRDYCRKTGLQKLHLGLSGGIDSAVVACLAADALGPHALTVFGLPGPFNQKKSLTLAKKLSENLGCQWREVDINPLYKAHLKAFEATSGKLKFGLVHENLQARLRANLLMMHANHQGSLLLSTSNKSEMATGYSTLYGDQCGGLAPLGDLLKNQVFSLAHLYNSQYELIPKGIIERPPSAELRPGQKDEDSLPPYHLLDDSVHRMVTLSEAPSKKRDKDLLKMLALSEFKRWQAPPILKVTAHAFGRGRRFPITHRTFR